jgi:hypothetical protein
VAQFSTVIVAHFSTVTDSYRDARVSVAGGWMKSVTRARDPSVVTATGAGEGYVVSR